MTVRRWVAGACLLAGSVAWAQRPSPVQWTIEQQSPTAGAAVSMVDVRITANIQPHWHVYAMSGESDGATHLSFTLPPDSPFVLARPVKTAAAFPFESSVGGKTSVVNAYQGTAIFAMTLRRVAAKSATAPLVVNVRYQACSDTMCRPPKTEQLSLDLSRGPR